MNKSLLIYIIFFFTPLFSFSQYTWTQRASMPFPKYGAASFTIGSSSYVGTGYNTTNTATNDWWKYDQTTNSWSQVASMTGTRNAAAAFSINGKGYCGLGFASSHKTDFYEYDPVANTWSPKATFPAAGRYGFAYFTIGNVGYITGGNLGGAFGPFSNTTYGYDALTNSWSQKADMPGIARYGGRGIELNNKGYIFGGLNDASSGSLFFNDIWEFDPVINSWTQKMGISGSGRAYASVFVLNNKIICGNGNHTSGIYATFEAFDPMTNSWSPVPSMPSSEARWAATSFSSNGNGYVCSGNKSGTSTLNLSDGLWELSYSTSQNEIENQNEIQFYLSQMSGSNTMEITVHSNKFQDYNISIYNSSGQLIAKSRIKNGTSSITSNFNKGVILAVLSSVNGQKLIAKKSFAN